MTAAGRAGHGWARSTRWEPRPPGDQRPTASLYPDQCALRVQPERRMVGEGDSLSPPTCSSAGHNVPDKMGRGDKPRQVTRQSRGQSLRDPPTREATPGPRLSATFEKRPIRTRPHYEAVRLPLHSVWGGVRRSEPRYAPAVDGTARRALPAACGCRPCPRVEPVLQGCITGRPDGRTRGHWA